jgi:hypothetical protein
MAVGPIRPGETIDAGVIQATRMGDLPRWLRRLYIWYIRYIKRDEIYAGVLDGWCKKTVPEYWNLSAQRQAYRSKWFHMWNREQLDFVITVVNPLPAVPHGGMKEGVSTVNYTMLWNLAS